MQYAIATGLSFLLLLLASSAVMADDEEPDCRGAAHTLEVHNYCVRTKGIPEDEVRYTSPNEFMVSSAPVCRTHADGSRTCTHTGRHIVRVRQVPWVIGERTGTPSKNWGMVPIDDDEDDPQYLVCNGMSYDRDRSCPEQQHAEDAHHVPPVRGRARYSEDGRDLTWRFDRKRRPDSNDPPIMALDAERCGAFEGVTRCVAPGVRNEPWGECVDLVERLPSGLTREWRECRRS